MKKTVIGAIALLGAMAVTPVSAKETISAVGSSSVTPLMEVFSETYMKKNWKGKGRKGEEGLREKRGERGKEIVITKGRRQMKTVLR